MCLKGKSTHKEKAGNYKCKKCGAVSKKKSKVCKAKRISE